MDEPKPMDEETQQGMVDELIEILEGMKESLQRALPLADELSERTEIQILSSIEVAQLGVKSAMRELPAD